MKAPTASEQVMPAAILPEDVELEVVLFLVNADIADGLAGIPERDRTIKHPNRWLFNELDKPLIRLNAVLNEQLVGFLAA